MLTAKNMGRTPPPIPLERTVGKKEDVSHKTLVIDMLSTAGDKNSQNYKKEVGFFGLGPQRSSLSCSMILRLL